jgi:hypothetical protein
MLLVNIMRSLAIIFDELLATDRKTWPELKELLRVYKSLTGGMPEARAKWFSHVERNWSYHSSREELARRDQALWDETEIDERIDHHAIVYLFDGSQECYKGSISLFAECLAADRHLVCHFVTAVLRSFHIAYDGKRWWKSHCDSDTDFRSHGREIPEEVVSHLITSDIARIVSAACGSASPQVNVLTGLITEAGLHPLLKSMCWKATSRFDDMVLDQFRAFVSGTCTGCPDCGSPASEADSEEE